MKKYDVSIFVILSILLASCITNKKFETKYFSKEYSNEIHNHLKSIGFKQDSLKSNVLLISRVTYCGSCLNELKWWNQNRNKYNNLSVTILLLEPYTSVAENFISLENINIPVIIDSSNYLINKNLIPYVPIKYHINSNEKILKIDDIGSRGSLDDFVRGF